MHLSFTDSKYHVHDMTLQTQNLGNQVKVRLTSYYLQFMRTQFNDAKLTKNVCIRKINVLQLMKTFKTHIKKGDTNCKCAFPIGIKVVNVCHCCKIPYLFQFFLY